MTTEYPYGDAVRDVTRVGDEHGLDAERRVSKYQGNLGLTVNQAREIVDVLWADAPEAEKKAAALLCHSYRLNPLARHVYLISFGGKWARVMGIGAKRLLARRPLPNTTCERPFSYLDWCPRIMTEAEQIKVYGKPDADNICFVTILQDVKTGAIAYGFGKFGKKEVVHGIDKGNSRENMAGIRSESAALDRLRPGEMPTDTVVVDEAYVEGESHPVPPESEAGTTASPEPIITEEEIDDLWGTKAKAKPQPQPTTAKDKPRDPKTPEELAAWCKAHTIDGEMVKKLCGVDWATAKTDISATVNTLREKLKITD